LYLVRIQYFAGCCTIIRFHQSNQTHSTTCQALLICKYHIPSIFPSCNLQSMNMFIQLSFFYVRCDYEKKVFKPWWSTIQSISTNPPLTCKSLTTIKTTTHNVENPGTGSGRANTFLCWYRWHGRPSVFTLSFHNICNFCYSKKHWYKASECQHKIEEHFF
jgi:hypothetical protein